MSQFIAITRNTFVQTARQPIYAIIVLVTLGGLALAPSLTGWTLDDDNKMLRDLGLSTLLVQGLFLSCFAASAVLNSEIEDKTVLTSLAKPVGRPVIVLGKYAGVLGALLVAHGLAGAAFYMAMRHGVMQTASDKLDMVVLIFGPGMMLVVLLAAAVTNYTLDWRYLPTVIAMSVPAAMFGSLVLVVVDRDWKLNRYEVEQSMDNLPAAVVKPGVLGDIIEIRPLAGHGLIEGNRAKLVRSLWDGPITGAERRHLLDLAPKHKGWVRDVDFLVKECRAEFQSIEIVKAGILIVGAIALLTAIALATATRFGMITTFVVCILAAAMGLVGEHYLLPRTQVARLQMERAGLEGESAGSSDAARFGATGDLDSRIADLDRRIAESTGRNWADYTYAILPNIQVFWMVDALSDDRTIPWRYIASAFGYAGLYILALLALAAALFETREVG